MLIATADQTIRTKSDRLTLFTRKLVIIAKVGMDNGYNGTRWNVYRVGIFLLLSSFNMSVKAMLDLLNGKVVHTDF